MRYVSRCEVRNELRPIQAGGPGSPMLLSLASDRAAGLLAEPGPKPTALIWPMWADFADFIRRTVKPPAEAEKRVAAIEAAAAAATG